MFIIIFVRKLTTLNEEEPVTSFVSSEHLAAENEPQLANLPVLSENVINSLLEQAKCEGLYPLSEANRSESSSKFFLVVLTFLHSSVDKSFPT